MIIGSNKLPYCSDVMFNCWIRSLLISSSKVSFTYPTFFVYHNRALWSTYRPPSRLNLSFFSSLLMLIGVFIKLRPPRWAPFHKLVFRLSSFNWFKSILTTSRSELDFTRVSTLLFKGTIDQNCQSWLYKLTSLNDNRKLESSTCKWIVFYRRKSCIYSFVMLPKE